MDLYLHTFGLRCNYEHQAEFDVFSFLDMAAAYGFRGVNISFYGPDYIWTSGNSPDQLARIKDRLEVLRLAVDLESNGTDRRSLLTLLDAAVALGAGAVRTYATVGRVPDERCEIAAGDLRRAAGWAEDRGIPILFENHEDLTGSEVARILSEVDSPWIGALFDYGNAMCSGEEPLVALDAMGPWIRTGHLKDQLCVAGEGDSDSTELIGVPVGVGNLPVRQITERLIELGVERVCVENCWAYESAVRSWRGGAESGAGSFALFPQSSLEGTGVAAHHRMSAQQLAAAELEMLAATVDGVGESLRGLDIAPTLGPRVGRERAF